MSGDYSCLERVSRAATSDMATTAHNIDVNIISMPRVRTPVNQSTNKPVSKGLIDSLAIVATKLIVSRSEAF